MYIFSHPHQLCKIGIIPILQIRKLETRAVTSQGHVAQSSLRPKTHWWAQISYRCAETLTTWALRRLCRAGGSWSACLLPSFHLPQGLVLIQVSLSMCSITLKTLQNADMVNTFQCIILKPQMKTAKFLLLTWHKNISQLNNMK